MKMKFGSMKNHKGLLGVRCIVFYPMNPFKQLINAVSQFFHFRSLGLIRFLRLPGFRVVVVVKRKDSQKIQPMNG